MKRYTYVGKEPKHLGRFGEVHVNDVLLLTDQEAESVEKGGCDFLVSGIKKVKVKEPDQRLTAEQSAAAAKAEQERKEKLLRENADSRVALQELRERPREVLIAFCEHVKKQVPSFEFKKTYSREDLLACALRGHAMLSDIEQEGVEATEPTPEKE